MHQQNHQKYILLQSKGSNIAIKEAHDGEHGNLMKNLFVDKNIQKLHQSDSSLI